MTPARPTQATRRSPAKAEAVRIPHRRSLGLQDVLFLKGLIEGDEYRAVIDRAYPLEDVIEAHRYVDTQQKVGNVS